jgi:NAD(P)-dependent dehydrogenase (short-subunit alcohol dehydrogenase family)
MLDGKVTLVTGASRGIGYATAIALAKAGARVVVAARNAGGLEKVVERISGLNGVCLPVQADVTDEASVRRLVERAIAHFDRIDVLINNAGAVVYGPAERARIEDWDTVIDTNLKGPFLCMREIIPIMTRQDGGHIINVASQTGLNGFPNLAIYCASKFGLIGLSKSLGRELSSSKIRVSYVCPGYVDTDLLAVFPREVVTQASKISPEHVAEEILRLAAMRPGTSSRGGLLRRAVRALQRRLGNAWSDTYSSF